MSILRNYELSYWQDIFNISTGAVEEQKIFVFGADEIISQSRAQEPRLKRKIDGSNELSFKMYYEYIDNITGEKIHNPFIDYLINETKIKLHFENKWYDFVIKDIQENSTEKYYIFLTQDQHIVELSKNGFGLTLDTKLENNIGTATELANTILEDTDWTVDGTEKIPQTLEEALIEVKLSNAINAYCLIDSNSVAPVASNYTTTIPKNSIIYLFYSCCKDKTSRLQFIYCSGNISTNTDRIIINKNSQFFIDNVNYISDSDFEKYGLFKPQISLLNGTINISNEYRGKKYVFSAKNLYNAVLDKYVTVYKDKENGQIYHGFSETEIITPNIIKNYATNNTFTSTQGWRGTYFYDSNETKHTEASVSNMLTPDILENLENLENTEFIPSLQLFFPNTYQMKDVVVNSSFYDNRKNFEGFKHHQKFVLLFSSLNRFDNSSVNAPPLTIEVGEQEFDKEHNGYIYNSDNVFLRFKTDSNTPKVILNDRQYFYVVAEVTKKVSIEDQKKQIIQTFITSGLAANHQFKFTDFQIFPYYASNSPGIGFITPFDEISSTILTKYYRFNPNSEINKKATSRDQMDIDESLVSFDMQLDYLEGAEKINTVNVKQSNYFNAIQSLCETFECWADFVIEHDNETGKILSKTVKLRNYIGQDNYFGFIYGINLKNIQRKIDSKAIVTKLLVASNSNQHAKNGYCAISRAAANETGEDYIYNFTYYLNKKLLPAEGWTRNLYDTTNSKGLDINSGHADWNYIGYYTRLRRINEELVNIDQQIERFMIPLMQVQSDITQYEAMKMAAEEGFVDNRLSFSKIANFDYTEITTNERKNLVSTNSTLNKYLLKIVENLNNLDTATTKLQEAKSTETQYKERLETLQQRRESGLEYKKQLNKAFFKTFYRYIQEGSWVDNSAIDDEKYYIAANSVAYNSCLPKITYTIDVQTLSGVEGYEAIRYNLGDKTWMEDVEFFGYQPGTSIPYREEVTITEITYALDEPDKDQIVVRNYRNQFQDLFQRITASVQQVNYTSGAWDNSAALVEANEADKSKFIQNALNYSETILTNSGEQSVVWDKTGITITDKLFPNRQLRIVAGGILIRDDDGKHVGWKTGITSSGINAKLITAGQIDTGVIQIMRGDEPYFRWDSFGITAYDFQYNSEQDFTYNLNTNKGVRFDRFGIYGFNNIDGAQWHPTDLENIRDNAQFGLTWDGLFLKLGQRQYKTNTEEIKWHNPFAVIGKVDNDIFNYFDENGIPNYSFTDEDKNKPLFTRIFAAGETKDSDGKPEYNLVIYDNGTMACKSLYLVEGIHYAVDTSPSRRVYVTPNQEGKLPEPPSEKTRYSSFEDKNKYEWHQLRLSTDTHYSETENAGDTWSEPRLIVKAIKETINEYQIGTSGLNPENLSVDQWNKNYPVTTLTSNQCIYIRTYDIYDDNTTSIYRYSVGGERGEKGEKGDNAINCYVESLSGNLFLEGSISTITLTARIYSSNNEVDKDGKLSYTWFINETKQTDARFNGKTITIPFSTIQNKSIYFEAE